MKNLILLSLGLILLSGCAQAAKAPESGSHPASGPDNISGPKNDSPEQAAAIDGTYQADAGNSTLNWTGRRIVAGSHTGTIRIKSGEVKFADDRIESGEFIIDMNTIEESNNTERLINHLKSDDFFSVAAYPESRLVIKSGEPQGGGGYQITAGLTIKGITEAITFPARIERQGDKLRATAEFSIDRSRWNVRYGSDTFFDNLGDTAISNEIEYRLVILAEKT